MVNQRIDDWLTRFLWYKKDTPETIEQKVYLVRNMIGAAIVISIDLILLLILYGYQLFLITSTLVLYMIITVGLLKIIKRGINWFLHLYYGGYIVICSIIILVYGGLPWSAGIWGGSVICFLLVLGLKKNRFLFVNAFIYLLCLFVLEFSYPHLVPYKYVTAQSNNLFFTINEIWICLFLVKSFYDNIILKTEENKRKAEQLQELDLLKSKLYANIAHEFRTPLTLIKANAEEIRELHHGETKKQKRVTGKNSGEDFGSPQPFPFFISINSILRDSDKVLFLINQMLSLSRIEEGGIPMHYVRGDLIAFVRLIAGSFQGYADYKKITLHYKPGCQQLIMDLEPEKLEESLANLLSNAIKYTPEGGDVFVTVQKTGSNRQKAEQRVEISVRDTGNGIPEDQLDKIFLRFYRIEDQHYPYQESSGIGLTLVSEYLKLMKGSIRVSSCPGIGSDFVIVLPVKQTAPLAELHPVKGPFSPIVPFSDSKIKYENRIQRPHLLIVEDNQEMSHYLTGLLANEYEIFSAENGLQGLEQAVEHIPDLILSDVMMPGKDGYQLCKELKKDFRTNHIPIVLLTARTDTESKIKGMECGADAYLSKPFDKRELVVCLHNLFLQMQTLRLKYQTNLFEGQYLEATDGLNGKFLSRVTNLLEKNYFNDQYGLKNLYSDLGISRIQLYRKLTALTGQSASNFIRSFRLQKARKILLESNKNIIDIAYEVGFSDPNYFSKAFAIEYGLTATELRRTFKSSVLEQ